MLTQFGTFCRKLRIDNGELLKNMADKLEVTSSYLSAVETGKRNVPHDWIEKITNFYQLNDESKNQLKFAIENSVPSIKIDLRNTSNQDKNLVMAFAREFKELNEEKKTQILKILRNGGDEGVN
ncbi:transcriptional regulator with XRE-family HTH domain [Paenibacillus sp. SORGH_AS306]|uniref:helix-turn-helix domain-containing protein n=1 Tax=unclassified Paenibacillus TaxID=185978 RepID=UPI00277D3604|nr:MULTISPECIES: helix-turn-helix transcriptional regulator [unclassified Paenibacillus]MDQ1236708.1 transcriptional regulator with XRE-family HTH domain [Paenibacillus sp. SORGH_AS_0306]MDR6109065.1 transcriptional regulator with XRE-family HTH domain [Paenibacillus sp. SORGH_AS_0338]